MFLLPQEAWEVRTRTYKNAEGKKKQNRGIFAKKDIEAGTVIGDYLGLLIPIKDEEKYENGEELYLMYYDEEKTIFPDVKEPGLHLFNHSCEPNSYMYTYKGRAIYFAVRKIFKGEELTISYQLSPIDEDCEPCIHACLCGTPSCTGIMHLSEEKYDAWREFDEKQAAMTKTLPAKAGERLQFLDTYPATIKDNSFYTLFGSSKKRPFVMKGKTFPSKKTIRENIRKTGRMLSYPKLGITIRGTEGSKIFLVTNR